MMCHEVEKTLDVKLEDMPAQVSPAMSLSPAVLCGVLIKIKGMCECLVFLCEGARFLSLSVSRKWRCLSQ